MKRSRREQSEILAERIAEKVVNKDGTVTIKPTGWRFSDVAWMARTAIELGMLAVSSKARKVGNALSVPAACCKTTRCCETRC